MPRRRGLAAVSILLLGAALAAQQPPAPARPQPGTMDEAVAASVASDPRIRRALFDLLQPVVLQRCNLQRFGEASDGGYLLCADLLAGARAAYSYGISGYDQWGCDVSTRLKVRLHQYDCFDTRQPACPSGDAVFHAECVADRSYKEEGRSFDTMASQFARNGDAGKRLVVKMDVEGAEWDALLNATDETLERIEQLAIELHFVHDEKYVAVLKRLRRFFHVAHLHFNNFSCTPGMEPFPAWAYEVLFVNKRLAQVDATRKWRMHPASAPNSPERPDCQTAPPAGK